MDAGGHAHLKGFSGGSLVTAPRSHTVSMSDGNREGVSLASLCFLPSLPLSVVGMSNEAQAGGVEGRNFTTFLISQTGWQIRWHVSRLFDLTAGVFVMMRVDLCKRPMGEMYAPGV